MSLERQVKLTAPLNNILNSISKEEIVNAKRILDQYLKIYEDMIKSNEPPHKRALTFCTLVEEAITDYLKKFPEIEKKITCKAGCSACCKNVINKITDDEAALIIEYCKFNDIDIDIEKLEIQSKNRNQKQWNKLRPSQKTCVFLGDDDLCKVYEIRPISCRKVLLLSDPKLCKRTTPCRIKRVISPLAEVLDCVVLNVRPIDTLSRSVIKVLNQIDNKQKECEQDEIFHTPESMGNIGANNTPTSSL